MSPDWAHTWPDRRPPAASEPSPQADLAPAAEQSEEEVWVFRPPVARADRTNEHEPAVMRVTAAPTTETPEASSDPAPPDAGSPSEQPETSGPDAPADGPPRPAWLLRPSQRAPSPAAGAAEPLPAMLANAIRVNPAAGPLGRPQVGQPPAPAPAPHPRQAEPQPVRPAPASVASTVPPPSPRSTSGATPEWRFTGPRVSVGSTPAKAALALLLLLALVGGAIAWVLPARDRGGHDLGLSLTAGRDYRFLMHGGFEGKVQSSNATRPISLAVEGSLTWHVLSVDANGVATVQATFESMTRDGGRSLPPFRVGGQIRVTKDGRLLSAVPPSGGGLAGVLFSLRQMSPLLPSRPVQPGATWNAVFDQQMPPAGGSVTLSVRGTLVRYDTVAGSSTAVVTNDVTVPDTSAGAGSIYQRTSLDPIAGELLESSILGKVNLPLEIGAGRAAPRIVGTATLQLERDRMEGPSHPAAIAETTKELSAAQAQDLLRRGLSAADVYFTGNQTYSGFTPTAASSISPLLRWMRDDKAESGVVTIRKALKGSILLVTRTDDGQRYCIARKAGTVRYGHVGARWPGGCKGGW